MNECALLPWSIGYAGRLAKLANDADVSRYLLPNFPYPYLTKDAHDWITAGAATAPGVHLAIVVDGLLAGGIGANVGTADEHAGSAMVGYWLGQGYWGRGIATEVVRSFTVYVFDVLRVERAWANVMAPNRASMRVLEKAGYRHEATLRRAIRDRTGAIHDEHIYALLRDESAL